MARPSLRAWHRPSERVIRSALRSKPSKGSSSTMARCPGVCFQRMARLKLPTGPGARKEHSASLKGISTGEWKQASTGKQSASVVEEVGAGVVAEVLTTTWLLP
jgi:hypothetical protein